MSKKAKRRKVVSRGTQQSSIEKMLERMEAFRIRNLLQRRKRKQR